MSQKRQRIDEDVCELVLLAKKVLLEYEKKRYDFSGTVGYAMINLLDKYNIKNEKDIIELQKEIISNNSMMAKYRIDNNFSPLLRDKLNSLSYYLSKEKITKKRLNMEELVDNLFQHYIEDYPEFNKSLLQDKYVFQNKKIKQFTESQSVYKNV